MSYAGLRRCGVETGYAEGVSKPCAFAVGLNEIIDTRQIFSAKCSRSCVCTSESWEALLEVGSGTQLQEEAVIQKPHKQNRHLEFRSSRECQEEEKLS